jgi:hypothetical protein
LEIPFFIAAVSSKFLLYFHIYNGKTGVSAIVFNNIMERPKSDIFSTCVFNNIMEYTFIFPPPLFAGPAKVK